MTDAQLYDVVVEEAGRIVSVTVWKRVELDRAIRLANRDRQKYEEGTNDRVGLMRSGSSYLNCKVKAVDTDFEFPNYTTINGKKYPQGKIKGSIIIFEPIKI